MNNNNFHSVEDLPVWARQLFTDARELLQATGPNLVEPLVYQQEGCSDDPDRRMLAIAPAKLDLSVSAESEGTPIHSYIQKVDVMGLVQLFSDVEEVIYHMNSTDDPHMCVSGTYEGCATALIVFGNTRECTPLRSIKEQVRLLLEQV